MGGTYFFCNENGRKVGSNILLQGLGHSGVLGSGVRTAVMCAGTAH